MGMMQTQPWSKSLAPTRIKAAKDPPPGSAPPLVPRTGRGRGGDAKVTSLEKEKKKKKRKEKTRGA
jgi:hypothetical protein